jgi:hypothetical protein
MLAHVNDEDDAPVVGELEYVVLGLLVKDRPEVAVTLMLFLPGKQVTDWGWYEQSRFEITNPSLPPNWVYWDHGAGSFSLMPGAWTRPGHWDDMFSEDRTVRDRAWSDYRAERDLILEHAGKPPGRGGSVGILPAPPNNPGR